MDLKQRSENMRTFFNSKAEESYDEVHAFYMNTKEMISEKLECGTKNILDLGGGTGLELISVFKKFPDAKVTVIDISEKMLGMLDKRDFAGKVTKICGDFFEVDFGKDYDAVISTSALHHFLKEDKLRLFEKICKCLRSGGVFINSDKFANTPEDEAKALEDYYRYKDMLPHIDTPLTAEEESRLLFEAGFENIDIFDCDAEYYKLIKASKA